MVDSSNFTRTPLPQLWVFGNTDLHIYVKLDLQSLCLISGVSKTIENVYTNSQNHSPTSVHETKWQMPVYDVVRRFVTFAFIGYIKNIVQ
jgi:hypothetical protein